MLGKEEGIGMCVAGGKPLRYSLLLTDALLFVSWSAFVIGFTHFTLYSPAVILFCLVFSSSS